MSHEFRLLCRRPLPEMPDGWESEKWPKPKTAVPVVMWRESVERWHEEFTALVAQLEQDGGGAPDLKPLLDENIADVLCVRCAPAQKEAAEEYLAVVADATSGLIVVDASEVRIESTEEPRHGTADEILTAWQAADAARAEREAEHDRLQNEVWERQRTEDPEAVAFANDWSDVAPDSEPPPPPSEP